MKTAQEKKKELRKYNSLCKKIYYLEQRKAEMWLGSVISAPCTDKTPTGAPDGTKTERFVEKIDKIEADIKKFNLERLQLKKKLEAAISRLDNCQEKKIITEMYLSGHQEYIDTVACKLHYSERHTRRLRDRAIAKLDV